MPVISARRRHMIPKLEDYESKTSLDSIVSTYPKKQRWECNCPSCPLIHNPPYPSLLSAPEVRLASQPSRAESQNSGNFQSPLGH